MNQTITIQTLDSLAVMKLIIKLINYKAVTY